MWAVRVLTGPQAGQIFPLKYGSNTLGRAPTCSIKIVSPGVSKEHTKIDVLDDKFIIADMGSRNGTFVNGTQFRSTKVQPGDKIGLHDIIIEIIPFAPAATPRGPAASAPPLRSYGNAAPQLQDFSPQMNFPGPAPVMDAADPGQLAMSRNPGLGGFVQEYLDRVVLPGIYHLAEMMAFKWVLALFMAAFILLVTSLSTIPLIRILRSTVQEQSQQHALTIAATLARVNESAVRDGVYSAINMTTANRVGVKDALIIQALDGKILAPASKAESFPDIPFVHDARKRGREAVQQVDSGTVVALFPVDSYNAEKGSRETLAYAVVVYDMSSLAIDDSKTLSLFIINLFIASILGAILFFFLYKLIEHPIHSLNTQLDTALKEGRDNLKVSYDFAPLIKLCANINSALTRTLTGQDSPTPRALEHDRRLEMVNLVELVGFAALAIAAHDRTISAVNRAFQERTGLNPEQFINSSVETVSDQALKLSLIDLMDRLEQNPDEMATHELEFGGQNNQILAQAIFGTDKIAYFVIVLVPMDGGAG